ncbi:AAA family ATPase [Phocaeicola plebeius]|mgnify:FL=1|uniref:AAA family ATPase n=1 Tax=Phocaeicola plebeius TaxID=310297 RepID=UPI002943529E|nr:AAA family ATPase [Phocaeicola plebeius]
MKYPTGIQSFDRIIEDGYVYVDKMDMVYSIAKDGSIYFLSRPRGFGKSLLVSTLKNYFFRAQGAFRGLKVDSLEKECTVYLVFHMDFNGGEYICPGSLRDTIASYMSGFLACYSWVNNVGLLAGGR